MICMLNGSKRYFKLNRNNKVFVLNNNPSLMYNNKYKIMAII